MYQRYLKPIFLVVLIAIVSFSTAPLKSRAGSEPLVMRSVGILDDDGSALYSVIVASGTEALGKVSIQASAPENGILVEAVEAVWWKNLI
jgi:hypothetical protein